MWLYPSLFPHYQTQNNHYHISFVIWCWKWNLPLSLSVANELPLLVIFGRLLDSLSVLSFRSSSFNKISRGLRRQPYWWNLRIEGLRSIGFSAYFCRYVFWELGGWDQKYRLVNRIAVDRFCGSVFLIRCHAAQWMHVELRAAGWLQAYFQFDNNRALFLFDYEHSSLAV